MVTNKVVTIIIVIIVFLLCIMLFSNSILHAGDAMLQ